MRSNYKPIGNYVHQVSLRNKDLIVTEKPQGVNISKEFMRSVANTRGTDLSKYRVVMKNQFAFNPMHVGRDEILPIAMLNYDKSIIVSPAYQVFEVTDHEELLPEYLMMWMRRSEFDREAWFTTDSSVRGGFSWSDFCNMELPVPHIDKQREIVKEYHTIVDRIALNEELNHKLEETAQAIYRQWFVEFEFPVSKEYAEEIGKPELVGKPYKSSSGEMVFNEELEKDIPKGWEVGTLGEYATVKSGYAFKSTWWKESGIPVVKIGSIQNNTIDIEAIAFVNEGNVIKAQKSKALPGDIVIAMTGATIGKIGLIPDLNTDVYINQRVGLFNLGDQPLKTVPFLYYTLLQQYVLDEIRNVGGDSAQANISGDQIGDIKVLHPTAEVVKVYNSHLTEFIKLSLSKKTQNDSLIKLSQLLMKKMTKVGA